MARSNNRVTNFGRFMDPLADKILVTSALIALVLGRIVHYWLVLPIVVRDIVITGMRLYGVYHGRQMETSRPGQVEDLRPAAGCRHHPFRHRPSGGLRPLRVGPPAPLEESLVPTLSNGLMGAVLLLTLASGFHYFIRTGYSVRS